jgi:prophage antirepressor-like protein
MLTKRFENTPIAHIVENDELYFDGQDICVALGYVTPVKSESKLFYRNQSLLEKFVIIRQFDDKNTRGRKKQVRFYSELGAYLLIMKARTQKAEQLQIWMSEMVRQYRQQRQNLFTLGVEEELTRIKSLFNEMKQQVNRIEHKLDRKQLSKKVYRKKKRIEGVKQLNQFFR